MIRSGAAESAVGAMTGIAATVLSMAFVNNSIVTDFSLIFVNLAQMLVAFYIVQGIVNLASKLNEHDMVKQGGQVRIYLLIAYSVPIAVDLIAIILSLSKKSLLANVFSLAGSSRTCDSFFNKVALVAGLDHPIRFI